MHLVALGQLRDCVTPKSLELQPTANIKSPIATFVSLPHSCTLSKPEIAEPTVPHNTSGENATDRTDAKVTDG